VKRVEEAWLGLAERAKLNGALSREVCELGEAIRWLTSLAADLVQVLDLA